MNISKRTFMLAVLVAAGAGTLMGAAAPKTVKWIWPQSLDGVNAAPNIHKVLFENDHVRLLEVTVHAGEKEPLHGHQYPSVFAYDAPQPALDNQQLVSGNVQGGQYSVTHAPRTMMTATFPMCRTMGPQAPHSVHIVDNFEQHFYRLEFKKIDGLGILNYK